MSKPKLLPRCRCCGREPIGKKYTSHGTSRPMWMIQCICQNEILDGGSICAVVGSGESFAASKRIAEARWRKVMK